MENYNIIHNWETHVQLMRITNSYFASVTMIRYKLKG